MTSELFEVMFPSCRSPAHCKSEFAGPTRAGRPNWEGGPWDAAVLPVMTLSFTVTSAPSPKSAVGLIAMPPPKATSFSAPTHVCDSGPDVVRPPVTVTPEIVTFNR